MNEAFKKPLEDADRKVAGLKERLQAASVTARGRLDRLDRYLSEDAHIDANGVLQSAAVEVDKLCALYEAAIENRNILRYYAER